MPLYRVEALEKFIVRTVYLVDAPNAGSAQRMVMTGDVGYDRHQIEEGGDEWIRTESITPVGDNYREPCNRIAGP